MTIKTHHNVGGLPEPSMKFELIEPLRELFKDEVRKVGRELGCPKTIVWRHPFPGPGLAVRCLGDVTEREARRAARRPTRSILEEIARRGSTTRSGRRSPCCCRSGRVGVMGDDRTYENVVALRAVRATTA